MIITATPVRISFFGGGTDYPSYYRRHGGATLATAVDKYVYVTVQSLSKYYEYRIQVHYSRIEKVNTLDEVQIPNVRESLRLLGIAGGVEIHLMSDLPARTGLGTSSATTVGLLKALYGYQGRLIGNEEVARKALLVEQEMMRERVGSQDQFASAFGGFLHLQFERDDRIFVTPVPLPKERVDALRARLMMLYSGVQRTAHDLLEEQLQKTLEGRLDEKLELMKGHVSQAVNILAGDAPLRPFGELMHEAWRLKRSLSSRVSNPRIDEIYSRALDAGAIGGKLLGAGGGGFILLFVEPSDRERVRRALPEVAEVPFDFEPRGARIVHYEP